MTLYCDHCDREASRCPTYQERRAEATRVIRQRRHDAFLAQQERAASEPESASARGNPLLVRMSAGEFYDEQA